MAQHQMHHNYKSWFKGQTIKTVSVSNGSRGPCF